MTSPSPRSNTPIRALATIPRSGGFALGLRIKLLLTTILAIIPPVVVATFVDLRHGGLSEWLWFGLALLISGLIASSAGMLIARPVEALTADAHAIAAGIESHRSEVLSSDEVGELASAFNQMADKIERRTAALADNERRYRMLFDSNPLPMWTWDAESTDIIAVNQAALDKYGYSREEFLDLRISELLDPMELGRFQQVRLPFTETRQHAGLWVHRTASGERLSMEIITSSTRRMGRPNWLSVGLDVTARHEAETALARSQERVQQMQKLEATGSFAAGMSQDFSNLLNGIMRCADLLLLQAEGDSAAHREANEIRSLAGRASDLIRQIMAFNHGEELQSITVLAEDGTCVSEMPCTGR